MSEKGTDTNKNNISSDLMFEVFLRIALMNAERTNEAFKHDLTFQREQFIAKMVDMFRHNTNPKEGDDNTEGQYIISKNTLPKFKKEGDE